MLDQVDQRWQIFAGRKKQPVSTNFKSRSQINPISLYNTLDTIIWMAEFQDDQRVVQVTKSLATYFGSIRVKFGYI